MLHSCTVPCLLFDNETIEMFILLNKAVTGLCTVLEMCKLIVKLPLFQFPFGPIKNWFDPVIFPRLLDQMSSNVKMLFRMFFSILVFIAY